MALPYASSFDGTLGWSETQCQIGLTASTVESYTVPGRSDQKFILTFGMSSNANIFVGYNVTPAVPGANTVTQQVRVEFITPDTQRYAIGGDVLKFITPDTTAYVGVSVREIPNGR